MSEVSKQPKQALNVMYAVDDERVESSRYDRKRLVYRHTKPIRITHWLNFIFMTIMLMSGLQIFNARPNLSIGSRTNFKHPFLAFKTEHKNHKLIGITQVLGYDFDTTGVLGVSANLNGRPTYRAFPAWATLPSDTHGLTLGRRWHFFFAWLFALNGFAFAVYAIFSGHLWRDLLPSRAALRGIGHSIVDHIRFRYPENERGQYNVLQKLSYVVVIFGLGPLIVATGLTMSPQIDSALPWLLPLFGGRQTARTIHFITAFTFTAFFAIHILMVLVSGPLNNLRSMITGRHAIKTSGERHEQPK